LHYELDLDLREPSRPARKLYNGIASRTGRATAKDDAVRTEDLVTYLNLVAAAVRTHEVIAVPSPHESSAPRSANLRLVVPSWQSPR